MALKIKNNMKYLIIISSFFCGFSYGQQTKKCDKKEALICADKVIKKSGYNLKWLTSIVNEDSTTYIISYKSIDSNVRGNSAEVQISKKNCKVIAKKFYQ